MSFVADPDYTLHHRAEIFAIVERMQKERTLTTVEFADGHAIVSSILQVRRDSDALVLDVARDAGQNRRMFASTRLAFVGELDHVQVAFETGAASLVKLSDGPAALVELPEAVVRLQRRESFRAALPIQPPVRCTVVDEAGHATTAQAIDLSAGGTALIMANPVEATSTPGSGHELVLSLPDIGRVEIEATLRSILPASPTTRGGTSTVRLGFRFESLSSRTANEIQRYVQHIEVTHLRVLRMRD